MHADTNTSVSRVNFSKQDCTETSAIDGTFDNAVLCADIGGSFIKFGVSRRLGDVEQVENVPMPATSWPEFVAALQGLITRHGGGLAPDTPLAISTAGLVSPHNGKMLSTNIPAFTGQHLATELEALFARRVYVANDADCFTLAEAFAGYAQGMPIVAGIILGTGVGGGVVINGQLLRGHGGVTGEWGHGAIVRTELNLDGKKASIPRLPCGCGQRGCLDTLGGARGMERLHTHLHQRENTSREIVDAWRRGDNHAALTINVWLTLVAEPLSLLVNILGPSIIVAGGGLAGADDVINALDARVRAGVLHAYSSALVIAGKFTQNGGLIGASVLGRLA